MYVVGAINNDNRETMYFFTLTSFLDLCVVEGIQKPHFLDRPLAHLSHEHRAKVFAKANDQFVRETEAQVAYQENVASFYLNPFDDASSDALSLPVSCPTNHGWSHSIAFSYRSRTTHIIGSMNDRCTSGDLIVFHQ